MSPAEIAETAVPDTRKARPRAGVVAIVVALVAVIVFLIVYATRGGGVSAGQVARDADAVSCTSTGYTLQNRLDNSKQTVFDCSFAGDTDKCVTDAHGLASDVTSEVSLLFANTLGGDKPSCLP